MATAAAAVSRAPSNARDKSAARVRQLYQARVARLKPVWVARLAATLQQRAEFLSAQHAPYLQAFVVRPGRTYASLGRGAGVTFHALESARSISHLSSRAGVLFDTCQWAHSGFFTNTCPFDSAVFEAHRLLCDDAVLRALLAERAAPAWGHARQKVASAALLDMHRFASARMWDEARMVAVHYTLSTTCTLDDAFARDGLLDLTSGCYHLDNMFAAAGALIADFERVPVTRCPVQGCQRQPNLPAPVVVVTRDAMTAEWSFAQRLCASLYGDSHEECECHSAAAAAAAGQGRINLVDDDGCAIARLHCLNVLCFLPASWYFVDCIVH